MSWTEPQPSGFSETSPTTIAAVGDQILVLGWSRTSDSEGHGVLFLGTPDDELSAFTRTDLDWIDIPRAVASDGERVVVACRSSLRTTSLPIGSSEWSKFDADSLGSSLADVAYHGGRFVAVGSRDTEVSVLTSSDGMSWSRAPVP